MLSVKKKREIRKCNVVPCSFATHTQSLITETVLQKHYTKIWFIRSYWEHEKVNGCVSAFSCVRFTNEIEIKLEAKRWGRVIGRVLHYSISKAGASKPMYSKCFQLNPIRPIIKTSFRVNWNIFEHSILRIEPHEWLVGVFWESVCGPYELLLHFS